MQSLAPGASEDDKPVLYFAHEEQKKKAKIEKTRSQLLFKGRLSEFEDRNENNILSCPGSSGIGYGCP